MSDLERAWERIHESDLVGQGLALAQKLRPRAGLAIECALWGVRHQARIHYAQVRPIPLARPHRLPVLPFTTDCSGFVTMCIRYSGAPDPNGQHYDGQGYTGTLLAHNRHVTLAELRPGDLVVYGCRSIPAGHHVGLVRRIRRRDPAGVDTVSHGNEQGPVTITVAAEAAGQPDGLGGIIYLRPRWR